MERRTIGLSEAETPRVIAASASACGRVTRQHIAQQCARGPTRAIMCDRGAGSVLQSNAREAPPWATASPPGLPALCGLKGSTGAFARWPSHNAGRAGGSQASDFRSNITEAAPVADVVDTARQGLMGLREERKASYLDGMNRLGKNTEVLDFAKAENAFTKAIGDFGYKGRFPKTLEPLRKEVEGLLDEWRGLDPAEYHTPEGFDQLKKDLWAIQGEHKIGTAQHSFVQGVRKAVEGEIKSQAPEYAKVMKDYRTASETIDELERTMSLGSKATTDTSLRKLQSIMRNNANTNYGARVKLGDILEQHGATNLKAMLAGQSLSAWAPRGIGRAVTATTLPAAMMHPAFLGMLPMQSPRLMGEAAYGLGAMQRGGAAAMNMSRLPEVGLSPRGIGLGAFQAGRVAGVEER